MRLLIIEDEPNAIERLEKMIHEVAPEKKIVGKCHGIGETIDWLEQHELPDLILSDVQLTDGLSFDIFSRMEKKVPVIFISAYDKYALEAFRAQGLHYLLKPVKAADLKEAIQRYDNKNKRPGAESKTSQAAPPVVSKQYQERFIINVGAQIKLVHDTDIAFIYTENKMVYLTTFNNQKYIIDLSLESLEKCLNPKTFFRINRQFIVSLSAIVKMVPASKQRIELTLQPASTYETITSFERTAQFKKWLLGEV